MKSWTYRDTWAIMSLPFFYINTFIPNFASIIMAGISKLLLTMHWMIITISDFIIFTHYNATYIAPSPYPSKWHNHHSTLQDTSNDTALTSIQRRLGGAYPLPRVLAIRFPGLRTVSPMSSASIHVGNAKLFKPTKWKRTKFSKGTKHFKL